MVEHLAALLGFLVRNPQTLFPILAGAVWLHWKGERLAGGGLIARPARAGLLGGLLLIAATVGFLVVIRNPRNRHAATTMAIGAAVVAALAVAWWSPTLRAQLAVPALVVLLVWAFCPGDLLYTGQPGGAVWQWLDGELPTPAAVRAALQRDRRNRLAPAALAACTDTAQVRAQHVDDQGRIVAELAIDAGASPAAIQQMIDDGTFQNALNRIAEQQHAGVEAVAARMEQRDGAARIVVDTTPSRLPKTVPWPGGAA